MWFEPESKTNDERVSKNAKVNLAGLVVVRGKVYNQYTWELACDVVRVVVKITTTRKIISACAKSVAVSVDTRYMYGSPFLFHLHRVAT